MSMKQPARLPGLTCVASLVALFCATPVGAQTIVLTSEPSDQFDGERLTFDDAVERALGQNPTVVVAKDELLRSRALLEQVRAASLPTLNANGTYTRLDHNRVIKGSNTVLQYANSVNGNLTVNLPVNPRSYVQWSHAGDNVNIASLSLEDTMRLIGLSTGRAYLTVLVQRNLVQTSRTARDAARAHEAYAQQRLQGGVGNRIDLVRAQQELATSDAQLANAKVALERAREALGIVGGENGPVDSADEPDLMYRDSLERALTDAMQRSDIREATLRRDAAHRVLRDSWTDYLPFMNLIFQPFLQNPATPTVPAKGWQAQVLLTAPLYDGGLRYGYRKERTALEREAQANLDNMVRQARSDVRIAWDSVREADRALFSAREAARLAKDALALANLSYREGTGTNLDLIDAERQARDTDTAAALAADTARQARLDLLEASGRFPKKR